MNTPHKTTTTNLIEITEQGNITMKYGFDQTLLMLMEILKSNPRVRATVTTLTTLSISQLTEKEKDSMLRLMDENSKKMNEIDRRSEKPSSYKRRNITLIIHNSQQYEKDTIR